MTYADEQYMARALHLAERGLWTTDPNPRVGCVLVHGGEVVGEGWHIRAGEPHAEVYALQAAGARARGATAYVTLEPCAHQGRTPPCSHALIQAGVARVVVAMSDPNPLVAGRGLQQLRDAGIEVSSGLLQTQAEALNPGFIKRMRSGMPYVRAKLAMSLDGRTALANGASQWITGAAARSDVQALRARSSAILTGIGTVLADDPALTVRATELPEAYPSTTAGVRQPLRVVVDTHLSMPEQAKMLSLPGDTLVITATDDPERRQELEAVGAQVLYLPTRAANVDLTALCQALAQREVNELHLECGANLGGAFLRAGLIDELVIYMAPSLLGDQAKGLLHLPPLVALSERVQLRIREIRAVGDDWRISAHILPSTP